MSDVLIEAAEAQIAAGTPDDALDRLAAVCSDLAADPRLYRVGFEALCAAVTAGRADDLPPERATLYRELLLQEECEEPQLIFAHGVASLLTSNNEATAQAVTAALKPVLHRILEEGDPARPLLIFLMVARSCIDDRPSQAEITRWHLDAFPTFSNADLTLPYSVMFNADHFGRNQADLLRQYGSVAAILNAEPALGLRHILLLEWLGAPNPFPDRHNRDLMEKLEQCLPARENQEAEEAAARSLILRHWRQGSVISDQRTQALGLGAAVLEAAAKRPHKSSDYGVEPGAARISRRRYQVAQAARQFAARRIPFLARPERGIRVAICVSGQLRGYRTALASWRRTMLANISHDIFVHTWEKIGRSGAQPFRNVLPFEGEAFCAAWRRYGTLEGYEAMQERYPALFAALEAGDRITKAELYETYGARAVVVDDETAPPFFTLSNPEKMHYKTWAAHRLAVESGKNYDLILRIRPDYGLRLLAFSWRDMAAVSFEHSIIWADHPFGVHYGNPMIGDQIALGAPAAMEIYATAWKTYLPLARLGLTAAAPKFQGHISFGQTTWLNRVETRRLPVKSLGLMDAERLSAADIRRALRSDTYRRREAVDRALLEAIDRDLA